LDPEGLYIQTVLEFEGITLKAELVAQVKVKEKGKDEGVSVGDKWVVEINMLRYTFETPKFYFNRK
jgi:hypothetical protein